MFKIKRGNIETTLELIDIDAIDFNDKTFRFRLEITKEELRQLTTSIKKIGLQNPVKLRKKGDRYQILAGWSRLKALKTLGVLKVLAEVYNNITDRQALMIASSDNIHRSSLSDLEMSNQLHTLYKKHNVDIKTLIDWFGGRRQRVFDLLKLQSMNERLKNAVHTGELSLYAAVELHKFSDRTQANYVERAIGEKWSVNRIKKERKMCVHPFEGVYSDEDREETKGCFHALKYMRFHVAETMIKRAWETENKGIGVPGPHHCEVTATIKARERDPPYICHNKIEWVIVSRGRIDPHGRDTENPGDHMQTWPAWLFVCDECSKLVVPSIEYHEDIPFVIPLLNHYGIQNPSPDASPMEPYFALPT
jgi:ParB family chromosome partitioning protein